MSAKSRPGARRQEGPPAWMLYPSSSAADQTPLRQSEAAKRFVDRLEKHGVYLRPYGPPGSGKFRAYDSLWNFLAMGTVDQIAARLDISLEEPSSSAAEPQETQDAALPQ
jgi:hypothetical protein